MVMIDILKYKQDMKDEWDKFVESSKNGTFLLKRDYMEYHKSRFLDYSLVFKVKGKVVALLPANISDDIVYSHLGLTYGGFICGYAMNAPLMGDLIVSMENYLRNSGIRKLIIKRIPHIYESAPSEDDLYIFHKIQAKLIRRDLATTIAFPNRIPYDRLRKRRLKRAQDLGIRVTESDDFRDFWMILTENLKSRYGKLPVHSLEEIEYLKKLFPKNIRLFTSLYKEQIVSGVVVYETSTVAHLQYSASSEFGKKISAEDPIIDYLIGYYSSNKKYLDFGISTEDDGKYLNSNLLFYKEGFGGRSVVYDFYEVSISGE